MRPHPRQAFLGIWLSAAALACSGGDAVSSPAARTSPDRATDTAAVTAYRHRNHGGVIRLISVALQEVDLTPDQKVKLEMLRTALIAQIEPERAAGRELSDTLADGVAAGAVDRAKAEVAEAKLGEAAAQLRGAMTDGLDRLHAILTPPQRAALIAKMQVLWANWKDEWATATPELPTSDMAILTEKLGLSPDQVSRIQARFSSAMQGVVAEYGPRDVAARAQAFGAAFAADGFDARASEPHGVAPPTGFGGTRMTRFFEAFAPELTPAQRTTLAQAIRDHANRHDQP